MKQTHIKGIDTKGLRQAVTTVAIAGALAGWAVLARPEAPVAITTTSIAAPAAQSAAPAIVSAVQPAGGVTMAPAPLRVVTAPAPVTATRSSR